MIIGRDYITTYKEWLIQTLFGWTPTGQVGHRTVVEPPLAFVEYTGVPALFGGSVLPVTSQLAFQGGQAKYITQPAASAAGKPMTFRSALALEFIAGTLFMALALTIVDPADHRTGGIAETTWYKNNIVGGPEMWNTESKFDIGIDYV